MQYAGVFLPGGLYAATRELTNVVYVPNSFVDRIVRCEWQAVSIDQGDVFVCISSYLRCAWAASIDRSWSGVIILHRGRIYVLYDDNPDYSIFKVKLFGA